MTRRPTGFKGLDPREGDPAAREPRKAIINRNQIFHRRRYSLLRQSAKAMSMTGDTWAARKVSDHGASIGVRFPDRPLKIQTMKQHSEQRTGRAVGVLLQTLEQNVADSMSLRAPTMTMSCASQSNTTLSTPATLQ